MRWVVITLVLLNIAYFGWQMSLEKPVENDDEVVSFQYDKPLVLVSEKSDIVMLDKSADQQAEAKTDVVNVQSPIPAQSAKAEVKKTPPKVPAKSKSTGCYAVGPFLLVSDVSRAAQDFKRAGLEAQQRASVERKQVGYWVYIPPLKSLAEARNALRVLNDNKINDALLISEGSKANSISAGVYRSQALAVEGRDKIKALGFAAAIDPLYRTQPQYWLDLEAKKGGAIPGELWKQISRDYPGVSRKQSNCQ